jgi:hypothetical protein
MNDLLMVVRVIERIAELACPATQLVRFENFFFLLRAQIRKRFAVDVLHRNAARAFVVHEVINPHDVLMSQLETALRLPLQLIEQSVIVHDRIGKKFQRDFSFQLFIVRQPDNSHPASAQNLNQRVTAEESLSVDKLALRHVRRAAGSLAAHVVRILLEETAIKPKQLTLTVRRHRGIE